MIEHFDSFLSRRILSHRLDKKSFNDNKPKYLFLSSIEQWKKFDEYVKVGSRNKIILETDLQNYFEKIDIDLLGKTLFHCVDTLKEVGKVKAQIRFCIENVCRTLKNWAYNETSGLPQNRDVSSFLANMYMLPVDTFMIENKYDYYRYMDDIRIICDNKYQARKALKDLVNNLRTIGLNVNTAKTRIIEPGTEYHKEFFNNTSFELERVDALIKF